MSAPELTNNGDLRIAFDILSPDGWNQRIDDLWSDFPSGEDGLLPTHFLRSTYPKIGGQIVRYAEGDSRFWALLMPHRERDWTLKAYWLHANPEFKTRVHARVTTLLNTVTAGSVSWYETSQKRQERFSGEVIDEADTYTVSSPDNAQALEAVELQRRIWNVTDPAFVYPFDLYHPASGFATRLVTLHNQQVTGFLFGFYARGNQWSGGQERTGNWLESQLLGTDLEYRRTGIAKQLKLSQRKQALNEGTRLIHWTVDPLQAGNAYLNLNGLGGIAVNFYSNYYPFQNDLNRVTASRIGISWLLNTNRVQARVDGERPRLSFGNLAADSSTEKVEPIRYIDGIPLDVSNWKPLGDTLLIQIPQDWNAMQRDNLTLAQEWRHTTDAIFSKIMGTGEDDYALTGIVKDQENDRVYLIAERSPGRLAH